MPKGISADVGNLSGCGGGDERAGAAGDCSGGGAAPAAGSVAALSFRERGPRSALAGGVSCAAFSGAGDASCARLAGCPVIRGASRSGPQSTAQTKATPRMSSIRTNPLIDLIFTIIVRFAKRSVQQKIDDFSTGETLLGMADEERNQVPHHQGRISQVDAPEQLLARPPPAIQGDAEG